MDSREVRDLMEAYLDVYASEEVVDEATAMARRGYDETEIRRRIGRPGGGEAADRATALENRPTYGDTKRAEQRKNLARKQRRDFRNTASSNPGLHGYAHQSNDPAVKAKQAARGAQRGALTPNERKQLNMGDEFQNWVEALLDEGYDLSDYTWDEMYEAYSELVEENSGYNKEKIDKDPLAAMTPATFLNPPEPGKQFGSPRRRGPGGGRIPSSMAPTRTGAAVADIIRGGERNISRGRRLPTEPKTTKMVKKDGKWVKVEEVFDVVLAHLVSEGYANDFDSATKIMVNMSEEWINSIIGEAYVDYRKGKLPSGRTPRESLRSGVERADARAKIERRPGGFIATPSWNRAERAASVGREMDAHTGLGGKINKILKPGLGNRPGAFQPRVAYGEPNTDRHQRARTNRGQPSIYT